MEYRSSNVEGYTHHLGDIVAQVASSHGVQLSGGSTGGIVEAVGDDANISITVRGKGTGQVTLGNSSQTVVLGGTGAILQTGGSTAPFQGFLRLSTDITTPTFSTDLNDSTISTVTFTGVNSSHFIVVNPLNLSTGMILSRVWVGSTANEVKMMIHKSPTTVAVAGATTTFRFLAVRF